MKWLLRWCKIYDGIDLLGQIFLSIKNLEEINLFWSIEDNISKLKEIDIDVDFLKSEMNNDLKSKVMNFVYESFYNLLYYCLSLNFKL